LISTERLELRPPAVEDAAAVARYYSENEEHLRPWSPRRPPGFATEAHWRALVPRMESEWLAGRNLRLFGWPKGEPRIVGTVSLAQIAHGVLQQAYLGYDLAAAEQGKGYAREMVRAAVAFAFDEIGLHRVAANYMPRNERSARLLKDLGFEVEGRARAYLAINGRWEDHVMTALVNDRVLPS
jgi:ribosomal-protein-alanine N-acetyltransferase